MVTPYCNYQIELTPREQEYSGDTIWFHQPRSTNPAPAGIQRSRPGVARQTDLHSTATQC